MLPFHHSDQSCPRCGLSSPRGEICGECIKHPFAFDNTVAAFDFDFPVIELMHAFKYGGRLPLGQFFSDELIKPIREETRPHVLLPMPLHHARLRERGFNQSIEIARSISSTMNLPMSTNILIKTRDTAPQAGLPWDERRKNIKGAFECKESLLNQHIALVDDVMTTGASLNEAASVIRRSGASKISVWVVARTQLKN